MFQMDAAQLTDLDKYTFFYLANSFPDAILERVLHNILASCQRKRRHITLVYLTPVADQLVQSIGFEKFFEITDDKRLVRVYRLAVP